MDLFVLRTDRLLLDAPVHADVPAIAEHCADPAFERFMVTPWPYEPAHARSFVEHFVPEGWADGSEWTWAIRTGPDAPLLGAVGVRLRTGMVGYWLGRPHRGRGVMTEALACVISAVFDRTDRPDVRWECVAGNRASARVAERTGFRFTGLREGEIATRDGGPSSSWTGVLARDDRGPTAGWDLPG